MGVFNFIKNIFFEQKEGFFRSYYGYNRIEKEGNLKNGRKIGLWKEYHKNGKLKSKGNYKDNFKNGIWKYYYKTGELERTGLLNPLRNGTWKYYNENKELDHELDFRDNLEHGVSIGYFSNKKISYKYFNIEGKRVGEGRWFHENGNIYRLINYNNNIINGRVIEWDENGKLLTEFLKKKDKSRIKKLEKKLIDFVTFEEIESQFYSKIFIKQTHLIGNELKKITKDEEKVEKTSKKTTSKLKKKSNTINKRIWNRDLHITKPNQISLLVDDKLQNVKFWNYFLDNKPFNGIVYYVHNEQQIFESLNPSDFLLLPEEEKQKIIEYEFDIKDGVKDGKCRIFNENQELVGEYDIKKDVKNGCEVEYNNKKIISKKFYQEGVRHGLEEIYFDNGKTQKKLQWVNGKCTGELKVFYISGVLRTKTTYKNGKHVGPQSCWNESGEEIDCNLTPQLTNEIISNEELRRRK